MTAIPRWVSFVLGIAAATGLVALSEGAYLVRQFGSIRGAASTWTVAVAVYQITGGMMATLALLVAHALARLQGREKRASRLLVWAVLAVEFLGCGTILFVHWVVAPRNSRWNDPEGLLLTGMVAIVSVLLVLALPRVLLTRATYISTRATSPGLIWSLLTLLTLCLALPFAALRAMVRNSDEKSAPAEPSRSYDAASPANDVLVIVMDAVRPDRLSAFDSPLDFPTPATQRLADSGTLFRKAYSTSSWTLPGHASLLTGRYPDGLSSRGGHPCLLGGEPSLAEVLRSHGYATLLASANGAVGSASGMDVGFDEVLQNPAPQPGFESFFLFHVLFVLGGWHPLRDPPTAPSAPRVTEWVLERITYWTKRRVPYFVLINYMDAHQGRRAGDQGYNLGVIDIDRALARILSYLEHEGRLDSTLVMVTSDHGESLGEHGIRGHRMTLNEPEVRVPLIVHWPGNRTWPSVVEEPVSLVDLFPTVLQALSIEPRALQIDGRSLFAPQGDRPILLSLVPFDSAMGYTHGAIRAIRKGSYKLVSENGKRPRLFDVDIDPAELHDLASQRPDIVENLMRTLVEEAVASRQRGSPLELESSDPMTQQLRTMGYAD